MIIVNSKAIYLCTKKKSNFRTNIELIKKSVKSLNIRTLSDVTLNEKSDGSGTIVLGADSGINSIFRGSGWPGSAGKLAPAIEMIPDVRKVYRQITELQK